MQAISESGYPMSTERHFQELVGWLNDRSQNPTLKTLRIPHGDAWADLLPPTNCQSSRENERFYRRQGARLAILYALTATDLHVENPAPTAVTSADQPARERLRDSVMAVGLLPAPFHSRRTSAELADHGDAIETGFRDTYRLILVNREALLAGKGPTDRGLAVAQARIRRLGDEDLQQQTWFIRAALATLPGAGEGKAEARLPRRRTPNCETFLAAARTVGDRLAVTAIHAAGSASWLSLALEGDPVTPLEGRYQVGVVGNGLYEGLPGIIFFLAYLGEVSRESSYRALAEAALKTLESRREEIETQWPSDTFSGGAFSGWGGLIYLWTHLGVLWRRQDLLNRAVGALTRVEASLDKDERLDIISGCAGAIPCLLALHLYRPGSRAREIARLCGERLLSLAGPRRPGAGWSRLPLQRGFSHGTAGVAWALSELGSRTGQERYQRATREALSWERSLLTEGRWTDIHRNGDEPQATWCHGAPGIALSRLAIYRRNREPSLREEGLAALNAGLAASPCASHALGHGALGNLEPLLVAAECFPESVRFSAELKARAANVLKDIRLHGWRSALPHHIEAPGLMTGLAGIGYGLLRLSNPSRVPSVLTLAPPSEG